MRVFVTGGTGLVGTRLVRACCARGDEAVVLTREPSAAAAARLASLGRVRLVPGDPAQTGAWQDEVRGCDAVIHLAGENIFSKRWGAEEKALIRSSRVLGTRNVVAAIGRAPADLRPKTLVNASAVGYYGFRGDEELAEDGEPGSDFLASVCAEWEEEARAASAHGTRVVVVRIGIVLDPSGGALRNMLPAFQMFLGGPVGSGKQWLSWIHAEDLVGLILFAVDRPEISGPLNAVAPEPVRMGAFAKALGAALGRPSWLRVPAFALRLALGEVAEVLLHGQRVVPRKALEAGYKFRYENVEAALRAALEAACA